MEHVLVLYIQRGIKARDKHLCPGNQIEVMQLKRQYVIFRERKNLRVGESVRFQHYLCVPLYFFYFCTYIPHT